MLDPDYLKDCTQELENYWYNLETQILCDIAERIKLNENELTSTANHEIAIAQNIGVTQDRLNAYLSEALDITTEEASKLIEDSSYMSIESDNELFEDAYKKGLIDHFSYDKESFKDIINEGIALTVNDITNLCNTTAQTAQEKLYESLNSAYMMAQSGAFGSDVIVDRVVSKLSREGLEWIDYDTGVHRRLDTVVRMAVRTSINQTAAKCQEKNLDDLECNLVETSAHVGARPSHAEWQGQIFYRNKPYKDYSNFYDATGYGTAGGLCGVNCRHSFYPYIEGISTPSFDKVDSKENNELYEKQQEQRYNERHIREWKRRQKVGEAAGLDVTKEKAKVREWTKRNQELIASNSRLKRNYARERININSKSKTFNQESLKSNKVFFQDIIPDTFKFSQEKEANMINTYIAIDKAYMNDKKEHLSLNDTKTGKQLFSLFSSGNKNYVEPSKKAIQYIENAQKDSITSVHNHPKGGTFSVGDIITQLTTDSFKESIVITKDAEVFFFSQGKGDKILLNNDRQEKVFSRYVNLVRLSIKNDNPELSTKEIRHKAWIKICNKRGWEYGYKKF